MSTHSYIGIENVNGSVTFVYCHFDGYPDGVGMQLASMNREQAQGLIDEGDMRSIGDPFNDDGYDAPKYANSVKEFIAEAARNVPYAYVLRQSGEWEVASGGVIGSLEKTLRQ